MKYESAGIWRYRLTADYSFRYRGVLYLIPRGFEWSIGTGLVRLPPFVTGLLQSALDHDYAYGHLGPEEADRLMVLSLYRHGTPRVWRHRIIRAVTWYRVSCLRRGLGVG